MSEFALLKLFDLFVIRSEDLGQTSTVSNNVGILSCDFESSSICGYTQDKSDNFDWTRNHGGTGSANTGPFSDHTLGTTSGNYMYIETSRPRTPNQKARLLSPMTSYTTGAACVSFWYHMYGRNIGALNLYSKVGSTLGQPIWTRHSNQGNQWSTGQVTVQSSQAYQIVFEGIVGNGYAGDIAIDDVRVTAGACGASDKATPPVVKLAQTMITPKTMDKGDTSSLKQAVLVHQGRKPNFRVSPFLPLERAPNVSSSGTTCMAPTWAQ
ncbi:MAM domain-containing glycosylphosphatidylinositol anchor protein 1-like [Pecten maximus]|uniref:MAM domain-containing glycosylphosphatidylinositol anchor protein 1-like n=1 Tax=Pecten maximus TaxID=6579 RepID=UPI0014591A70|nr:MAM domain-containing glycosylphosphatidylinositol anchor protein 1-like [Pecten maximus]